jgi:hypothetical protein
MARPVEEDALLCNAEAQPFTDVECIGIVGGELRAKLTEPAEHFFSLPVDIGDLGEVDKHFGQNSVEANEVFDLFEASFCHAAGHPEGSVTQKIDTQHRFIPIFSILEVHGRGHSPRKA